MLLQLCCVCTALFKHLGFIIMTGNYKHCDGLLLLSMKWRLGIYEGHSCHSDALYFRVKGLIYVSEQEIQDYSIHNGYEIEGRHIILLWFRE